METQIRTITNNRTKKKISHVFSLFFLTNIKIGFICYRKPYEFICSHASYNISIMKQKKITEKKHTHTHQPNAIEMKCTIVVHICILPLIQMECILATCNVRRSRCCCCCFPFFFISTLIDRFANIIAIKSPPKNCDKFLQVETFRKA